TVPFHEGMANYFACAFGESPYWGEYAYIPWPNGQDSLLSNPAVINYARWGHLTVDGFLNVDPHTNGRIWSNALWDLRRVLGWTADSLALQCVHYLNFHPDFVQAAYAYLQADVDFHHGQHVDAIVAKFAARGIPIGLLDVHVSGPAELEPDQ